MPSRRRDDDRQVRWSWIEPAEVILSAERRGGRVLFEAPETSRIVRERTPRLPKVKVKKVRQPESMGLPFAARRSDGRVTCWSCAQELGEGEIVRMGPGAAVCPGCGARVPFLD